MQTSYALAVTPAVIGVILGAVIASVFPGTSPESLLYISLPEYQLWRVAVIAQISIYLSVATYLLFSRREAHLPALPARERISTTLIGLLVLSLPNILVRGATFPYHGQRIRMWVVTASAFIAILILLDRAAHIFAAIRSLYDIDTYRTLHGQARDLLMISGLVVTLGTIGAGTLQSSLAAMPDASTTYTNTLTTDHVLAYGAYFTLVLLLFFTPLLVVEQRTALRLAHLQADVPGAEVESQLGLKRSVIEYLGSAFGVLSPLLGALATRLLS